MISLCRDWQRMPKHLKLQVLYQATLRDELVEVREVQLDLPAVAILHQDVLPLVLSQQKNYLLLEQAAIGQLFVHLQEGKNIE